MKTIRFLYVYIVLCSDNSYYTGITNNPERRINEHNQGTNKKSYTFSRRPVKMVYCERFSDFSLAISWEKRIKKWSRSKKIALISEDWNKIKESSECRNETHFSYRGN